MPAKPPRISIVVSLVALAAMLAYGLAFLSQPLVGGAPELLRSHYLLNVLVYPEGLMSMWTDGGRLPLGFLDRIPILAATLAWLCLAAYLGWPAVSTNTFVNAHAIPQRLNHTHSYLTMIDAWRRQPIAWSLEKLCLASLVGLAWLSTLTLLLGLTGALHSRWPLLIAIGLLIVTRYWITARWLVQATNESNVAKAKDPLHSPLVDEVQLNPVLDNTAYGPFDAGLRTITKLVTLLLGVAILLGAWLPPTEFDVLEYHLQAPKEFFQQGAIGFVPHNIYANMPLGAEMHSLAAMTLWQQSDGWFGGLIGKSITASISLLGALLLGSVLAQRLGAMSGWMAAGLWLGCPGIAHVATQGLIDGVLASYLMATAIATWQVCPLWNQPCWSDASQSREQPAFNWQWLPAGVLAGACASIKYPGLVFATIPSVAIGAVCLYRVRKTHSKSLGTIVMLSLAGLSSTCLPWYAKNWWLASNPVYPLAANVFGGRTLTDQKIQQWQRAHQVPVSSGPGAALLEKAQSQARAFGNDVHRLTIGSEFVQPSLVIGLVSALCLIVVTRKQAWHDSIGLSWYATLVSALLWSLWILAVWWLATHRIDRFWLPVTGLWSMIAAWSLTHLRRLQLHWLAHLMLLPGLLYCLAVNVSPAVSDNRWFVSLGALRDDIGDEAGNAVPRIAYSLAWINQHLTKPGTKALLVGEARVFEYRVPVLYSTCFDTNPAEELLVNYTPAEQRQRLKAAGISHLMINWTEIARYRSPGNYGFSSWPQKADIEQLIADQVVRSVQWDIDPSNAQLLEVLSE